MPEYSITDYAVLISHDLNNAIESDLAASWTNLVHWDFFHSSIICGSMLGVSVIVLL